jgi:hypothetical protein
LLIYFGIKKYFEIGNFEKLETLAIKNEQKLILKKLSEKEVF